MRIFPLVAQSQVKSTAVIESLDVIKNTLSNKAAFLIFAVLVNPFVKGAGVDFETLTTSVTE